MVKNEMQNEDTDLLFAFCWAVLFLCPYDKTANNRIIKKADKCPNYTSHFLLFNFTVV